MSSEKKVSSSFSDTDIVALGDWSPEERSNLCLTVWVDCAALRIALCPVKDVKKAIYLNEINVSKASDVIQANESLRNSIAKYQCTVVYATMSFAGPISQDHVIITNWKCEARERIIHFSSLPFDIFPLDRRSFMNDLEANSYGIIAKSIGNSLPQIFSPLWDKSTNEKQISLDGSSCVMWMGDGFGVSYIVRNESSEYNCVVSTEASHGLVYLGSQNDSEYELEHDYIKYLSRKFHGGRILPEWEELTAFRGLTYGYRFLKQRKGIKLDKWPSYDQIRTMIMNNTDPDAMIAFRMQYRFIFRSMQSLVLAINCKRVFLISEAHVMNMPLVVKIADELQKTFENHPRSDWLKKVTVYCQHRSSQFALSGGLFLSRIYAVVNSQQEDFGGL